MILFLLVCVLVAAPIAFPGLGAWPVVALLVLWALTPTSKASADRKSREAAQARKGKGS